MIIDADTHFLPPDTYDYMGQEWDALRPRFTWNDKGMVSDVIFPGEPPLVPGATPLPPPGTGSNYRGMYYMDERLRDYEKLGMPLFLHNIQHGHRITNLMNYQFNGLDVLAPQEGQMSLVSLITSGLLDDFPKLNFVFTEAGVAFIKPLVLHLKHGSTTRWSITSRKTRHRVSITASSRAASASCRRRITNPRTGNPQTTISGPISFSLSKPKSPSCRKRWNCSAHRNSCLRPTIRTTIRAGA